MPDNLIAKIFQIAVIVFIVLAVFGWAILYHTSVFLFPWFVFFYIISGIGLIVFTVLLWRNWEDEAEIWGIALLVAIIVFLGSMAGANTTAKFIQQIPNTAEGKASLQAWDDVWFVIGIPEYVQGELNRALEEQSKEICKQYDEQICKSTQNIVATYKNSQELADWIDDGKTLYDFVSAKEDSAS